MNEASTRLGANLSNHPDFEAGLAIYVTSTAKSQKYAKYCEESSSGFIGGLSGCFRMPWRKTVGTKRTTIPGGLP